MGKFILGLLLSTFMAASWTFAQSGILVSPQPSADDGSIEVLDAPDQGNSNDLHHHKHHHRDPNDNDAFLKDPQNSDLYLFGGEYDSEGEVQNNSHRGSESRGAVYSGRSSATVPHKDGRSKKGEKQ